MKKECSTCGETFLLDEKNTTFLKKCSPYFLGKQLTFAEPRLCPTCRQRRRYSYRNDHHFYKNNCGLCNKAVISIYSPDKPYQVLCHNCFWSDRWDPLSLGREYDFNRTFFEQFQELRELTSRLAIFNAQSENCDFTVHSSRNRNCYHSSSIVDCEDVYYSDFILRSRESMDLYSCDRMELCYECSFCNDCFNSDYLELCSGLTDSFLCFDCKGSNFLIGCVGLRKKRYQILNQAASKAEYENTIARLKTEPTFLEDFEKKFRKLEKGSPKQCTWNLNCENSSGNYLTNCKNVYQGFNARETEDASYVYESFGPGNKDLYDVARCANSELLYECTGAGKLSRSFFCNLCYYSSNLLYCDNCQGASDSFGCMSLKKHKHCILNRQYSESEYQTLVPQIHEQMLVQEEWGEFFPEKYSPFGYNESKAFEWFSLSKEEVQKNKWRWSDYESPVPSGLKIRQAAELPVDISQVSNDIVKEAIICEVSAKPYRIITQELNFYKKKGLSIPRKSPRERDRERLAKRNPLNIWRRFCENCGTSVETSYSPDRPEIVFCDKCYLEHTY